MTERDYILLIGIILWAISTALYFSLKAVYDFELQRNSENKDVYIKRISIFASCKTISQCLFFCLTFVACIALGKWASISSLNDALLFLFPKKILPVHAAITIVIYTKLILIWKKKTKIIFSRIFTPKDSE